MSVPVSSIRLRSCLAEYAPINPVATRIRQAASTAISCFTFITVTSALCIFTAGSFRLINSISFLPVPENEDRHKPLEKGKRQNRKQKAYLYPAKTAFQAPLCRISSYPGKQPAKRRLLSDKSDCLNPEKVIFFLHSPLARGKAFFGQKIPNRITRAGTTCIIRRRS